MRKVWISFPKNRPESESPNFSHPYFHNFKENLYTKILLSMFWLMTGVWNIIIQHVMTFPKV